MSELREQLRDRGLRLTPQRQLVLQAVRALGHATPDELLTEVQKTASGINISTIYRTLELLDDLGLVTHTHLGHGAPTYHPAEAMNHLHLVCRDCDGVIEAELSATDGLVEALLAEHGFATDVRHLAVFGRCADCRAAGAGSL
jgi:Fur family transcriptional regulator, ferric uptake regulator